jgi:hypothetical protein
MQRQAVWKCFVREPRTLYADDHVCHGFGALLLGHVPLVYHLERGIQHWAVILPWPIDLDTLEGYLYQTSEEDLRQTVGHCGHGGQI